MVIKRSDFSFFIVLVLILYNFFMPTFNSKLGGEAGAGSVGAIIINAGIFILLLFYFFLCKNLDVPKNVFYFILLLFMIWFVIILLSILLSEEVIVRDVFELHRPLLYFLTFLFGANLAGWKENKRILFYKLIFFCLAILAVMSICQYLGFIQDITALYSKRINVFSGRGVGTFVNPYDLSFVLILPITFSLLYVYVKKFISLQLVLLFVFVSGLISTQSKTGLIILVMALALALLCGIIINVKKVNINDYIKLMSSFLLMFLIVCVGFYFIDLDYLAKNFSYLLVGLSEFINGNNNSFNIRLQQISTIVFSKQSLHDVIVGNGVQKGTIEIIENEYLLYFYRYGLVGLSIILVTLLSPFYSMLKIYKSEILFNRLNEWESLLIIACFIWCLVTLIASMTNTYVDIIRTQFLYYTIIGYMLGMACKKLY